MSNWICPHCNEEYQGYCDHRGRHAVADCRRRLEAQRDELARQLDRSERRVTEFLARRLEAAQQAEARIRRGESSAMHYMLLYYAAEAQVAELKEKLNEKVGEWGDVLGQLSGEELMHRKTREELARTTMRLALETGEVERLKVRDHLLDQLRAQIAIYFGREGDLATLQDGIRKGNAGQTIKCRGCGEVLWFRGALVGYHKEDCQVVVRYREVFPEGERE